MDAKNLFHTRATYTLERLDYTLATLILSALVLVHADEVNWAAFSIAFAWIDLVGYIPGAIVYRRALRLRQPFPLGFKILYNLTHSFATNGLLVLGWLTVSGFDWAMLAAPIHLCGDRGIFGNIYKPLGLSYEPREDPLFAKFESEYHLQPASRL